MRGIISLIHNRAKRNSRKKDSRKNISHSRLYDKYTIYQFSDESIIMEICKRIKMIRFSCCFSQQEFADKAGVSIIIIKRIESYKVNDITLSTQLKILQASGTLEGVMDLVPELPESPFLMLHDNQ